MSIRPLCRTILGVPALIGLSLTHRTAPLAVRERLALAPAEASDLLAALVATEAVDEAVAVSTCNRIEIYVAGELHRRRGDGHAGPCDPGAGAHPAAGAECVAHQAVQERPARARPARELVGAAQLTEDLGLAEDHRVEAGRDGEEMIGHGASAQRAESEPERRGGHAGVARERGDRGPLGRSGVLARDVDLDPVAGRDRDGLRDTRERGQFLQERLHLPVQQRQALADGQWRRLVRRAEHQQLAHRVTVSRSSSEAAAVRCSSRSATSLRSRSMRESLPAMIAT